MIYKSKTALAPKGDLKKWKRSGFCREFLNKDYELEELIMHKDAMSSQLTRELCQVIAADKKAEVAVKFTLLD